MNDAIFNFFYGFSHSSVFFDGLVIFLAVYLPILILFGISVFLIYQEKIYRTANMNLVFLRQFARRLIIIFGPAFITYLLATLLKELIHLDRSFVQNKEILPLFNPNQEYSFPSSHASIFSALAFTILFRYRKAGYLFLSFAVLIGLARIIAGVHFPADILGGFVLGFLVAYFAKNV